MEGGLVHKHKMMGCHARGRKERRGKGGKVRSLL